ncbi:MAG: NUDIX domain-containing protein [Desulfobulbaceae bacterium]|nr:NUDIX domain-containing protein [Desulfobulbaceae bacterium]
MNAIINNTAIKLKNDRYGGIIIDDSTLHHPPEELEENLIKVISDQADKNLMWITLPIEKSSLIPVFTKHDFKFYDCSEESITLFKKLTHNPSTPTATNHTIGVGAFVKDGNDILVVKDSIYRKYKLPGGYVNNKENISQALMREVFEETGIGVKMESIVSIGHFSPGQFNESNIYIVCKASPLSKTIHIADSHEIIEAKWLNIDTYLKSNDVHPYNKKIVTTAIKNKGIKHEVNDFFSTQNSHHEFFF